MNELKKFNFEGKNVRIVGKNGENWFIAKEICDILEIKNTSEAMTDLDEEERNTIVLNDSNRGNPKKNIVNESGLYSLIIKSRKPEAKKFKKWITHKVLPSIRKTGSYSIKPQNQFDIMHSMINRLEEQNKRLDVIESKIENNKLLPYNIDFFTLRGYCLFKSIELPPLSELQKLGKEARKLSQNKGYKIDKVPDEKYGKVNSYHLDVLDELFSF